MGFFDDRTYTQFATASTAGTENSGLAYDERCEEEYFYTHSNSAGNITRLDRTGVQVGATITLSFSFDDVESLCFLGPNGFDPGNGTTYYWALLEEGDAPAAAPYDHPRIYFFNMDKNTTSVSSVHTAELYGITTFSGQGAEGLAFDRTNKVFYVGVQQTASGGGGLWKVDTNVQIDTNGQWQQTLVGTWYNLVGAGGPSLIASNTSCGDMFLGPSWMTNGGSGTLFVLFNSGTGAGGTDIIIQMTTGGSVLSTYSHGVTAGGKWEGICFDDSSDQDLYIAGEPAGVDWIRYSVRTSTTAIAWESSWRYEDTHRNYFESSPIFHSASFDLESPPLPGTSRDGSLATQGAAFKTGNGWFGYGTIDGLSSPHAAPADTALLNHNSDARSCYFVKDITIADVSAYSSSKILHVRDDGVAVYVNGSLVHTSNTPATILHSNLSPSAIGGTAEGAKNGPFTVAISNFQTGSNRIAVMWFTNAANSSDGSFDMELVFDPDAAPLGGLSGCLSVTSSSTSTSSTSTSSTSTSSTSTSSTSTSSTSTSSTSTSSTSTSSTSTSSTSTSSTSTSSTSTSSTSTSSTSTSSTSTSTSSTSSSSSTSTSTSSTTTFAPFLRRHRFSYREVGGAYEMFDLKWRRKL